ncbi:AsnC family transcriptional regulator [Psychrosphaera saromensis]|jgi:Lrp/AsnC family leucine-responsive transcriptional regulator|uniref:Leucine-responsive regulatory protein n=1 Tax=Psychrosphaera saromensis TaxID=716813 RepID=A0A2S7UVW5_9GAMM|nr:leucine-responsive transcriptional regulator Lrp [Psychrosphaera saromensis]PQJ54134.1 leucine-responsive transcriptional regulator [Psychrosphaera saromensis]GHB79897.1 AsnC family transcriptional regulator [Psychrosphaera saromensis]GLQ12780.1 AsnC family transcriptional regulator [Psychrosphaera saromensis]
MNKTLDRIDKNILIELQKNGRVSNVDLSKLVGLSPTPCLERVKRLEKQGIIEGYKAVVNAEKVGASLLVFVEITLEKTAQDVFSDFSKSVSTFDEILECHLVSGSFDYLLKTRVKNMASYRKLLGDTLLRLPSVSASRTYVVMEEVKTNTAIPINI